MLNELLERLFRRSKDPDSRAEVKQRLKLLIAHDRADLSPALVESMQREILEVVSRYVEIDKSALSFSLESDRNSTALLANLPILRIKDKDEDKVTPSSVNSSVNSSDDDREEDSLDNLKFDDESEASASEASESESSESEASESEPRTSESSESEASESGVGESEASASEPGESEPSTSEDNTTPSLEVTSEETAPEEPLPQGEFLSAIDGEVMKNEELRRKNEELRMKNEELRMKNEE